MTRDAAASSVLGFIVGLAVLTGSLATAVYFVTTTPEAGSDRQEVETQGAARRGARILTTGPGQPPDWHTSPGDVQRVGLLEEGETRYASRAKIEKLQEGTVDGNDVLESWDIHNKTHGLRIEGRVEPVEIGGAPGVETYGVVHGQPSLVSDLDWPVASHSADAAELHEEVNPEYEYERHFWTFGETNDPSGGLGNTVADHAYFVETQLIPKMAGIEATYSTADHGTGNWENSAARQAMFDNYDEDNNQQPTRWHVVADGEPHGVPGNASSQGVSIGDHVLGVNFRRDQGNGGNGLGQWRVEDGARSVAMLGKTEVDGASSATLEFDHHLKVDADDGDLCVDLLELSCVRVRPSILFWNTTDGGHWDRLSEDPHGCPASGWDDVGAGEETSSWNQDAQVDLCEALDNTSGSLWLSFFWDTSCISSLGENTTCEDMTIGSSQSPRGWFLDNIELTVDGTTKYETDFEPPTGDNAQQLFVSNGVDHRRTHAPAHDHVEENTMVYIRNMVQAGGNVVALSPEDAPAGEWLSQVGLASVDTSHSPDATTDVPRELVVRYPNELPEESRDYNQENVSWQDGTPSTPSTWGLPSGFSASRMTSVQTGPSGEATLLVGTPYSGGGDVAAVSYNYTHFADQQLREDLYENLQGSVVFIDPTFSVDSAVPTNPGQNSGLPEPGNAPVATARDAMLVSVTKDDKYIAPLKVTVWLWRLG